MKSPALKYALCIESIFRDTDFRERLERTLESGYNAVEVWGVDDAKRKALLEAKERGVKTAMIVGARGFVTRDSGRIAQELESLKRNLDLARELECPNICLFVGDRDPDLLFDESREAVAGFLSQAAGILEGSGVTGIVESVSPGFHPRCFLISMREAIGIVREVNRPEIQLQFDLFHTAMTDPDLEGLVRDNLAITAYFQAADAPARHQPGTGRIDFKRLLTDIQNAGFGGYFCWEFSPDGDPMEAIRQAAAVQI